MGFVLHPRHGNETAVSHAGNSESGGEGQELG